ncbi:ribonuclease Z [Falsibacillus albus]|uniref:Ribonuclease Z n=1 Tax=Falsibacillus albus TaxID=2478915 RepID=A0A3L7JRJ3_9BACI|nr:ribonuclease Z [Falsibacillus albus]RLQ91132.1 ribonuclease Z [Falsibacillus albus]
MELLFLGTGAGVPAKIRNVTSLALKLLDERKAVWLFDCGEATQHQILSTNLKPRKIEKIFITHLHGDHIFGLPGFLGSRSFQGGTSLLTIYGPKGIKEFIDVSLKISDTHLQYPLEIIEIDEGTVFQDKQFTVEALPLDHALPSIGYRIIESDKPGTLQADRLAEMGIKPGPHFKHLKEGKSITLEDGSVIHGADFLGPHQKGRIVAILGDTRPCDNAVELARDADLLVHEATFSADSAEMAHNYFHSTTAQAADIAMRANVRSLVLTHISSRYGKDDWASMREEARSIFANSDIAFDFMEIDIPYSNRETGE